MSADNDILFPHSETLFCGDQSAALFGDQFAARRENSLDDLFRGDLFHHAAGNDGLYDLLLQISNYEPVLQNCERRQDETLLSYPRKCKTDSMCVSWELGKSCKTQDCMSTCDMPESDTISGTSSFDASLCTNDAGSLASFIGKAGSSSSEAIPADKRLSCLYLQQIVQALDMKEENCSLPEGDTHLQPDCAFASDPSSLTTITHDLLPATSLTRSAAEIDIEAAFVRDEMQERTLSLKDAKTSSSGPSFPGEDIVIDLTEDDLSPLPKSSLRQLPIKRSFSSHTLGHTIAKASTQKSSSCTSEPLQGPNSFQSTQNSDQSYPLHLQTHKPTQILPAMRRVYSTGDIQTFGRGSHFLPKCLNQEEGKLKICRYSSEERKVRISRYRQKRAERNFTKKIKYVCRKTLADNRPRVRGRFARNDDQTDHEAQRQECKPDDEDDGDVCLFYSG